MDTELRIYRELPFGDAVFWKAMLVIWNHFRLCDCVATYSQLKGTEMEQSPEVLAAISLFGCWLDAALEAGLDKED